VQARLDPRQSVPEAMQEMSRLHAYVARCGLEHSLLELVKLRASQMNGCAWCMDMHTKELRAAGEDEQRLYLLSVWRECPFFTDRERAALAGPKRSRRCPVEKCLTRCSRWRVRNSGKRSS